MKPRKISFFIIYFEAFDMSIHFMYQGETKIWKHLRKYVHLNCSSVTNMMLVELPRYCLGTDRVCQCDRPGQFTWPGLSVCGQVSSPGHRLDYNKHLVSMHACSSGIHFCDVLRYICPTHANVCVYK